MTREETVKWLESLKHDIGEAQHSDLWHYEQAIDMAIEALRAQEWEHGVPKHGRRVLVTLDTGVKGRVDIDWYSPDDGWYAHRHHVLAWMPLPEPYRKENDNVSK